MFDIQQKTINGSHRYYVKGDKQISQRSPLVSCSALAQYADAADTAGLLRWAANAALATGNPDQHSILSQIAMDIGSQLHQEIDQYISDSVPSSPSGLFDVWRESLKHQSIKWWQAEYRVYNRELLYGGTVDAVGRWNEDVVVFDWKTGNKSNYNFKPSQAVQVAGYCLALEQMNTLDPSIPVPTAGVIMYIYKNTGTAEWRFINLDQAKEVFRLCHSIYVRTLKGGLYE
jgi:hypothetical protein